MKFKRKTGLHRYAKMAYRGCNGFQYQRGFGGGNYSGYPEINHIYAARRNVKEKVVVCGCRLKKPENNRIKQCSQNPAIINRGKIPVFSNKEKVNDVLTRSNR